ncbi:MAG TPA: TldD/PmbA family protein [Thermoanaerobaculia bacterium]|nr:TldD/PmbA family protein [Thermoanaerobaculia bacterium]
MKDLAAAEKAVEMALEISSGDEADAVCMVTDRSLSRFASSVIHQNMAERAASLTIRVFERGSAGVATTSSIDKAGIEAAAALALDLARRSQPIPDFRGLHRSASRPAGNAWDEATARMTPAEKAESLRDVFERGRRDNLLFAGSFSTTSGALAAGNSHGVRQSAPLTAADISLIALGRGSASGYATAMSRRIAEIDVPALAAAASMKATMLEGKEETLEPGTWTVILEPAAITEVLDWLNNIAFSGQSFEDGSSLLVGNAGRRIMGENLTIEDDAVDPSFLPFPFDLEGLPKRKIALIEKGVARGPLTDKVAADRLGIEPTASAASLGGQERGMGLHLSMSGGDETLESLIAGTERGIWVTRFHYLNGLLDPKTALMTGMTRDGTFLIRNGSVVARLPNLRWTQSMVEAFSAIEGLTRERRIVGSYWNPLGGTRSPAVKIANWKISGRSGG